MPSISNAGGSLTSAIILTLLAWGVRWFRAELNKKKAQDTSKQKLSTLLGLYHAKLSPASLRMLVEHGVHPHLVFDVRTAPRESLPSELKGALPLPVHNMDAVLGSELAWYESFQGIPFPQPHFMLVFVGDTEDEEHMAASKAASAGFHRSMELDGCLENFQSGLHFQPDLRYIDREAVGMLLEEGSALSEIQRVLLVDVRRSDERALYGAIRGSVHIPLDQLPSALMLPADQFVKLYDFKKPNIDDLVIMSSRTNNRSAWAAQVAKDAGMQRCLVHRQGVYGWRFEPAVLPYREYSMLDPPPDPEPFQKEELDTDTGREQLFHLGLL